MTMVQNDVKIPAAGDVMVQGMFSLHILGPLIPINHDLNVTAYLRIVADHVHPPQFTIF